MTTERGRRSERRPLIVVNPRAARLHDRRAREEIVDAVVRAVRARTGWAPRVEDGLPRRSGRGARGRRSRGCAARRGVGRRRDDPTSARPRWPDVRRRWRSSPAARATCSPGSLGIGGRAPAIEAIRHGAATDHRPRRGPMGTARGVRHRPGSDHLPRRVRHGPRRPDHGRGRARVEAPDAVRCVCRGRAPRAAHASGPPSSASSPTASRSRCAATWPSSRTPASSSRAGSARDGPSTRPMAGSTCIVLGGGNPIAGLHGAARLMLGTKEEHEGVIRRARPVPSASRPIRRSRSRPTATTIRPAGSRRRSCRRPWPCSADLADRSRRSVS